jgi:hypothetical protein
MRQWLKKLWINLFSKSASVDESNPIPDWKSLSPEQQREAIVWIYAMAVCHKDNRPWHDAMDRCYMRGQCDTCCRIANAFVDVEIVMRSELMR